MTDFTWDEVELPLLLAVRAHEQESGEPVENNGQLRELYVEEGGTAEEPAVSIAIDALREAGLIDSLHEPGFGGRRDDDHLRIRLTPAGRRHIGQWPGSDTYELLLRLVERQIARADDEDERSRWQRLRDAAGDVSKETLGSVIAAAATGQIG